MDGFVMDVENFIRSMDVEFYTGVPDSLLRPLCDFLIDAYGVSGKHLIAANEGNCAALAAGYYLATGKVPLIYLQNSGIGNMINPVASLLHEKVYGIPCVFVVGWRGEPGETDEPQHAFQGEITLSLLRDLEIETCILKKNTSDEEWEIEIERIKTTLLKNRSIAIVVEKGALSYSDKRRYSNNYKMRREDILKHILEISEKDILVATTGKTSREVFEIRELRHENHECDFLTVGSMGHCSSIALGIALAKPEKRVWCIDGDGALLMHMGALALIGQRKPDNLIHVVINNGAHETVGGMPTVAGDINLVNIALGCGYHLAYSISDIETLDRILGRVKKTRQLTMIEIKSSIGSRENLGRPTTSTKENKIKFMEYLSRI